MLTPEQKQYILDNKDKRPFHIAKKLGISSNSVTFFLAHPNKKKSRISKVSYPDELKNFILDNVDNMSLVELSEHLKRPAASISYICEKLGVKPITLEEKRYYILWKNKNKSIDELAELMGINNLWVIKYLQEYNIPHKELMKDRDKPRLSKEARDLLNKWLDKIEEKVTGKKIASNRPPAVYTNIQNTYYK